MQKFILIHLSKELYFNKILYLYNIFRVCDRAVKELKRNHFGWKVAHKFEKDTPNQNYLRQNSSFSKKSGHSTNFSHR